MNALNGCFDDSGVIGNAVFCLNVLILREGDMGVGHSDPFQNFDADASR